MNTGVAAQRQAVARAARAAPASKEPILVRGLRALRWVEQFIRLLAALLPSGEAAKASVQCTASRLTDEFLRSLVLAEPPPITRFEKAFPDEAAAIERMTRRAAYAVLTNYFRDVSVDPAAKAFRDQHAKAHGCVRGALRIRDDLEAEFATGLFRRGARYDAVIRFSNARPTPQSDKKMDGRGMAIKLLDLPEQTMLSSLVPDLARRREQDFVLGSFPVFFCRSIVDYEPFMEALLAPTDGWRNRVAYVVRWVIFIFTHLRQMFLFVRAGMTKINNPLTATYHSMAPYLFGADRVVRYIVSPSAEEHGPPSPAASSRSANFLREALAAELDPVRGGREKVVLDFSVKVLHAPDAKAVEDATRWWNGPSDRTALLGHIEIPTQNFQTPDDICACENSAFNPWNCLPAHRPLGSLNRMRLAVYLASLQVRHKLNMLAR